MGAGKGYNEPDERDEDQFKQFLDYLESKNFAFCGDIITEQWQFELLRRFKALPGLQAKATRVSNMIMMYTFDGGRLFVLQRSYFNAIRPEISKEDQRAALDQIFELYLLLEALGCLNEGAKANLVKIANTSYLMQNGHPRIAMDFMYGKFDDDVLRLSKRSLGRRIPASETGFKLSMCVEVLVVQLLGKKGAQAVFAYHDKKWVESTSKQEIEGLIKRFGELMVETVRAVETFETKPDGVSEVVFYVTYEKAIQLINKFVKLPFDYQTLRAVTRLLALTKNDPRAEDINDYLAEAGYGFCLKRGMCTAKKCDWGHRGDMACFFVAPLKESDWKNIFGNYGPSVNKCSSILVGNGNNGADLAVLEPNHIDQTEFCKTIIFAPYRDLSPVGWYDDKVYTFDDDMFQVQFSSAPALGKCMVPFCGGSSATKRATHARPPLCSDHLTKFSKFVYPVLRHVDKEVVLPFFTGDTHSKQTVAVKVRRVDFAGEIPPMLRYFPGARPAVESNNNLRLTAFVPSELPRNTCLNCHKGNVSDVKSQDAEFSGLSLCKSCRNNISILCLRDVCRSGGIFIRYVGGICWLFITGVGNTAVAPPFGPLPKLPLKEVRREQLALPRGAPKMEPLALEVDKKTIFYLELQFYLPDSVGKLEDTPEGLDWYRPNYNDRKCRACNNTTPTRVRDGFCGPCVALIGVVSGAVRENKSKEPYYFHASNARIGVILSCNLITKDEIPDHPYIKGSKVALLQQKAPQCLPKKAIDSYKKLVSYKKLGGRAILKKKKNE
jgi:hypothetical protein